MSTILVKAAKHETYSNLGRYFFATMESGKHAVAVTVSPTYVQVQVQNASHRVWKGSGKRFPTMAAAVENYKTAEIKAMLQHVEQLKTETPVT